MGQRAGHPGYEQRQIDHGRAGKYSGKRRTGSGFAQEHQINPAPEDHAKRGGATQDNRKDGNHRRVRRIHAGQPPAVQRRERSARDAKVARLWTDFLLKQSEPWRQEKPADEQRKEGRGHARQKGSPRFAVRGEADDRDDGNRQDITHH